MRLIVWLLIALWSIQSQASEIRDAEEQRQRAEQQLQTLRQDAQLDMKKLKVIESELNRLNSESKKLTREISSSEQLLRELTETQRTTEGRIDSVAQELTDLLEQYRIELVAYYVTGSTLRADPTTDNQLADYLPFLLDARQQNARAIELKADDLRSLLLEQDQNTKIAQKTLIDLTDTRYA